jgi:ERCC4-type nuclease
MAIHHINISCDRNADVTLSDLISKKPDVVMTYEDIDVGSYIIGDHAVIDYQSAHNFTGSTQNKSIYKKVELLRAEYNFIMFVIEGNPLAERLYFEPDGMLSELSWLSSCMDIHIHFSESKERSATLISTMAKHMQYGLGYNPPLRCRKPVSTTVLTRYVLEGLPGVNGLVASRLADHFGSIKNIADASVIDLELCPGVSGIVAHRIYSSLRINSATEKPPEQ